MDRSQKIDLLYWLAAAALAVALMAAADLFHEFSLPIKWGFFIVCMLAATLCFLRAALLAWQNEEATPRRERPRRMIALVGMVVCGLAFLGFTAAFFWPSESSDGEAGGRALARLAELGWTVKPGENDVLFGVDGRPLPPMKESAVQFGQLQKPFRLHFQQVKGLEGLHYLAGIKGCTRIEISAGEFTDLSELRGFTHLTNLVISQVPLNGVGIVDPEPLASLVNLEELNLNHTRIRNSDFLVSLNRLTKLNLGQTLISEILSLSNLRLLESLEVRDTRVTGLQPLTSNKNLRELTISGTQVPSLTNLATMKNLKTLTLIEQGRVDLSPVGTLTSLESLFIWGLSHFDLLPLRNLTALQQLQLSGLGFGAVTFGSNLQAMGELKELKVLTLGNLPIANLNFTQNLKNLTEINLNQLPLSSIAPLRELKSLRKISLSDMPVADISPLLDLPELNDVRFLRVPARADVIKELERRGAKITSY